MSGRRKRGSFSSGYGLTRAERAMGGNTAQDRADIAAAAAVPRTRRYHQDINESAPAPAPVKPNPQESDK